MRASFVTLACYDWRLLPTSVAAYHDVADEVLVGLDADRRTWSGTPFALDRVALEAALARFPKCRIVEATFCVTNDPLANDCTERSFLATQARNEWVVEVDADELVDGPAVLAALEHVPPGHQLYGPWKTIVKVLGKTALMVDVTDGGQLCALATRSRARILARQTGEPPWPVPSLVVEHLQMARPLPELREKLAGYSHSDRIRPGYLEQLEALTLDNYAAARDLGPLRPSSWSALTAVPVSSLRWGQQLGGP